MQNVPRRYIKYRYTIGAVKKCGINGEMHLAFLRDAGRVLLKGGRAVNARSEEEQEGEQGGVRGRERATRNQRGVEFRGYRGERKKAREKGRASERLIREEGPRGDRQRGTGGHRHIIFSETRPCE